MRMTMNKMIRWVSTQDVESGNTVGTSKNLAEERMG